MPTLSERPPDRPQPNPKNLVERKTITLELKDFDQAGYGTFTGYASKFGIVDLQGDKVMPGAFRKTIADNAGLFVLLDQHDYKTEIGLVRVTEDSKGLLIEHGEFYVDANGDPTNEIKAAREAYVKMRRRHEAGKPLQFSIGYRAINPKFDGNTRLLTEIALAEISTVTFPALPEAVTTNVKNAGGDHVVSVRETIESVTARLKARADTEEKDFQGSFEARARRMQAWSIIDAALYTIGDVIDESMWAPLDELETTLAQLPQDLMDFTDAVVGAVRSYHNLDALKADRDEPEHHELESREHSTSVAAKANTPANSEPGDHSLTETLKQLNALKLRLAADQLQRDTKAITRGTSHA